MCGCVCLLKGLSIMTPDNTLVASPGLAAAALPLCLQNVGYKSQTGTQLIDDLSIGFAPGTLTAIVGHNGSGKSTALKLLANLIPATKGKVLVNGRPASTYGARDFAKQVAYLAQEPGDGADYTVEELITLGRFAWHGPFGRLKPSDHDAVERAIALAGLAPLRDRAVQTLSGGERQRCWIAVTLAQQSRCLLLDEPISALDLSHQLDVLMLLEKLVREDGLCVVAVLHDINLAARFSDRIVALRGGKLIAGDTPANIMTPETLRQIFEIDMMVQPHPVHGHPMALATA